MARFWFCGNGKGFRDDYLLADLDLGWIRDLIVLGNTPPILVVTSGLASNAR